MSGGSRSLSDSEISDIVNLLSIRDSTLVILGIRSGFRISELLSLRVTDCIQHGLIRNSLTVSRSKMKGKRASRSVPLHNEAKQAIERLIKYYGLSQDSYLFRSRVGENKPISRSQAHNVLKEATNALGLSGKVSSHSMRKSFATRVYLASGKDLKTTQLALGHSNLSSTSHYLSVDQDEVNSVILGIK